MPGAKDGTPLDAIWANDYAGFDAALFAQAGIVPSGAPDKKGASQRVDAINQLEKAASKITNANGGSVQDFIDAQYTTVAELATGKFQVGTYVRLTDRAMGLFLVQSSWSSGDYVLDAGSGNSAVYTNKTFAVMNHLGLSSTATDVQNGQAFLSAEKFKNIIIEPGVYNTNYICKLYSNSINKGVRSIEGMGGLFGVQINYTGEVSAIEASDKTALTGGSVNVRLTNFYLNFNGTDPDVVGIDLTRMRYTTVSGVFVSRFKDNVLLSESWGSKFYDMSNYDATGSGVKCLTENNGIEFHSPQLYRNGIAWDVANAPQVSIIGGITERNIVAIRCNNVELFSFSDHYFEANTTLANLEWLVGTVSLNRCRFKSQVGLSAALFNCDMGDQNRNGKLVVKNCVLRDVPATGKALVVTQGVLTVEWYDNSYVNWSHDQLRNILTTRYDKLSSNEPIQLVVMNAKYLPKKPPALYRDRSGNIKLSLLFSISENSANITLNPADQLVVKPPTFLSYLGVTDLNGVGGLTVLRVNSVGTIIAYFSTPADAVSNQSIVIDY